MLGERRSTQITWSWSARAAGASAAVAAAAGASAAVAAGAVAAELVHVYVFAFVLRRSSAAPPGQACPPAQGSTRRHRRIQSSPQSRWSHRHRGKQRPESPPATL